MLSFSSVKKVLSLSSKYTLLTMGYGFTRAVTYDYETKREYFNHSSEKYEVKPMLYVDRVCMVAGKSFSSMIKWPCMLRKDFSRLECWMYGKDYHEYGWD